METIKNVDELVEHPLTEEQRRTIRDGSLAANFIGSQYWAALIARMEHECRQALQAMYDCQSDDDRIIAAFWRTWKATERKRQDTENHFMALKEDYDAMQEQSRQGQLDAATKQVPADDFSGISDI